MKESNVTVTLSKAREWFNSGNATLREVALQAFSKDELVHNFKDITTFEEACGNISECLSQRQNMLI